jgi:DNA-binding NarL/FixJ family response regulator
MSPSLASGTVSPPPTTLPSHPQWRYSVKEIDVQQPSLIDVVVMHHDPLVSIGLAASLIGEPGFQILSPPKAAEPLPSMPQDAKDIATRVVIADLERGIGIVQEASRSGDATEVKHTKVVVLASSYSERDIQSALKAGVHGYLVMGCNIKEIAEGVRAVAMGRRHLCAAIAQRMADSLMCDRLTSREDDVLQLMVAGFSNKTIASRLDIATGTAKSHVRSILAKLSASSRTQATAIAAHRGLIDRKLVHTWHQSTLRHMPSRFPPSTVKPGHATRH